MPDATRLGALCGALKGLRLEEAPELRGLLRAGELRLVPAEELGPPRTIGNSFVVFFVAVVDRIEFPPLQM